MRMLMAAVCLPALLLILLAQSCTNEDPKTQPTPENPFKGQKTMTQAELDKFIADYPAYVRWAVSKGETEPTEQEIEGFIQGLGWPVIRFSYVMNQVMVGSMAMRMKDQLPQSRAQIKELEAERDRYMAKTDLKDDEKKEIAAQFNELIENKQEILRQIEEMPADELTLIRGSMDRLSVALAAGMPEIGESPEAFFNANETQAPETARP